MRFVVMLFCGLIGIQAAAAGQAVSSSADSSSAPAPVIVPAAILTFDHYRLTTSAPFVLTVKDGGHFAVRVIETDNRLFNYTITADTAAQPQSASATVESASATTESLDGPHSSVVVVMIHSSHFVRYRFHIELKAPPAAAPPVAPAGERASTGGDSGGAVPRPGVANATEPGYVLYATSFDVWVKTKQDFQVTFNGGMAFSGLRDHKYYIKTTPAATATGTPTKTVEEDSDGRDQFRPDVAIFATVRNPERFYGLGLSFGFGIGDSANVRYFLGPSWVFGKNFILNAGVSGGKVAVLPTGQTLSQPPINGDNTLNQLGSHFERRFYIGIGFVFDNRQQTDFLGPLAGGQSSQNPSTAKTPAATPAADLAKYQGTYGSDTGPDKVEVSVIGGKLSAKFSGTKSATLALTATTQADHFSVDGEQGATIQFAMASGKVTQVEYHSADGKTTIIAKVQK